jgi:LmbE family N-acetylglucosaminyl deacetylase
MRTPRALRRAVARAKPAVPEGLWPVLLTARSLVGDGPVIGLPALDRVLVLAAHPDDETVGCGGTMALLADQGTAVTVLFASDGDATVGSPHTPAETGRRRRAEAERAVAVLGATARFAGLPDGHLAEHHDELRSAIQAAVDELAPEVVLVPWFLDGHADHRAVSDALAGCALGEALVWGYEIWTALVPNRLVDITPAIERKRAALAEHATAFLAFDVSAGLELGRWRSTQGLLGRGYAEAFLALPAARYAELSAEVRPA